MLNLLAKAYRCIRKLLITSLLVSAGLVLLLRFVDPPSTTLMLWRWSAGEAVRHEWRDLSEISPVLQQAVMAAEDKQFASHFGFDWRRIQEALKKNPERRWPRSASTITMQTARNVFLWPGSDLVGTGLEAYFTLLMELFWSKARIMEVYVNSIEWGIGIFGAEEASKAYFNRPAAKINPRRAALLAAVLPDPRRLSPIRPSPRVSRRAAAIDRDMRTIAPVKK